MWCTVTSELCSQSSRLLKAQFAQITKQEKQKNISSLTSGDMYQKGQFRFPISVVESNENGLQRGLWIIQNSQDIWFWEGTFLFLKFSFKKLNSLSLYCVQTDIQKPA